MKIIQQIFLKVRSYKFCIAKVTKVAKDLTKSNKSKECMIYRYWFFNHGFKLQDSVCNGCHDLTI